MLIISNPMEVEMTEVITSQARWAETNADNCPYNPSTPEARVWRVAQYNGKAAASWAFDGNTPIGTYESVLQAIQTGDPAIFDKVMTPGLDGEYADGYTTDELLGDVGWVPNDGTDLAEALCTQYLDDVDTAFWHEIERLAIEGLS